MGPAQQTVCWGRDHSELGDAEEAFGQPACWVSRAPHYLHESCSSGGIGSTAWATEWVCWFSACTLIVNQLATAEPLPSGFPQSLQGDLSNATGWVTCQDSPPDRDWEAQYDGELARLGVDRDLGSMPETHSQLHIWCTMEGTVWGCMAACAVRVCAQCNQQLHSLPG